MHVGRKGMAIIRKDQFLFWYEIGLQFTKLLIPRHLVQFFFILMNRCIFVGQISNINVINQAQATSNTCSGTQSVLVIPKC